MRDVQCRVCGTDAPVAWDQVAVAEGQRVIECTVCGAHVVWRLWHRGWAMRTGTTSSCG